MKEVSEWHPHEYNFRFFLYYRYKFRTMNLICKTGLTLSAGLDLDFGKEMCTDCLKFLILQKKLFATTDQWIRSGLEAFCVFLKRLLIQALEDQRLKYT